MIWSEDEEVAKDDSDNEELRDYLEWILPQMMDERYDCHALSYEVINEDE